MYISTDKAIDTNYIPPIVVEPFTDLVKDVIVLAIFLESFFRCQSPHDQNAQEMSLGDGDCLSARSRAWHLALLVHMA
jgi:hypothetical protein